MPQHPVSCPSQLDLHRAAHPTYQNHLSPPSVMFGTDAGWEQKSLLFNSSPGLGHVPSVPQFPLQPSTVQSELHQRSVASTTLPPPPLFPLLQPGDKSTTSQARQTSVPRHILIFQPAPTLALLPPASSTVFMFHFPGNKRLVTMRRATAERLVKFVTHML